MIDNFPKSADSYEFYELMALWNYAQAIQEQEDKLNGLLNKHGLILFFTKGKDLYGAPEDSRVIFAKLKSDEDDDPMMPNFRQEARFPAINLFRSMTSGPEDSVESVFGMKDIPLLKVCDREKAIEMLMKCGCEK